MSSRPRWEDESFWACPRHLPGPARHYHTIERCGCGAARPPEPPPQPGPEESPGCVAPGCGRFSAPDSPYCSRACESRSLRLLLRRATGAELTAQAALSARIRSWETRTRNEGGA